MAELTGLRVIVKNNDINRALRDLKKKVYKENVMVEFRRHTAYEKPSEKKKRKHAEHMRQLRRDKIDMDLLEDN